MALNEKKHPQTHANTQKLINKTKYALNPSENNLEPEYYCAVIIVRSLLSTLSKNLVLSSKQPSSQGFSNS